MSSANRNDLLVQEYLDRLRHALRDLPASRRDPIIEEIADHIRIGREQMVQENESSVRQLLEQLGEPETIRAASGLPPLTRTSWGDRWAPWFLLFGGFVLLVGWIFGVVLLWQSSIWKVRDKILATLIWPGGLASVMYAFGFSIAALGSTSVCTSGPSMPTHCTASTPPVNPILSIILVIVAVAAPVIVNARLIQSYRRAAFD